MPRHCLMRWLARLRSHRPISHRRGEAASGENVQLFVGDLVQAVDPAAVALGELVQPDVGGSGHQHHPRHPVAVLAEALVLVLDAAQAGAVRGARGAGRRMHPHPQRDFLLVEDVEADDQPVHEAGQHEAPAGADVAELAGQRIRLGQGGRPKEGDQRLAFPAEARLVLEESLQAGDEVLVVGSLGQVGVVEQLVEGHEGRVHVGQPEQQQLFERDLAVGVALGLAGQIGGRIPAVAVHGQRRELLDEAGEGVIEPIRRELRHERGHGVGHDVRVDRPAVDLDGVMRDLVDQPHGVELGGVDDAVGEAGGVGPLVHAAGEGARGREVGDDDVAARLEERPVELVAVAGRLRYVELECHGFSRSCQPGRRSDR